MANNNLQHQIKLHLAKDNIEEAIGLLMEAVGDGKLSEQVVVQSARYYDLQKRVRGNVIGPQEAEQLKNQLRLAVFELANELPAAPTPPAAHLPASATNAKIPIFLSVGAPHNEVQQHYLDRLRTILEYHNVQADTLGATVWSIKSPLNPIQKRMTEVSGCLVLAMERFYAVEGVFKRGSAQEKKILNQQFPTPWTQIEAAMAYQTGLPLLILKDESLYGEGMLDPSTHEWFIVRINPEQPEELDRDPIKSFLSAWVEEVRAFYAAHFS